MLKIHCIKNAKNLKLTFDLRWAYVKGQAKSFDVDSSFVEALLVKYGILWMYYLQIHQKIFLIQGNVDL